MRNKLKITRRDFINGFALGLAGGTTLSPMEIFAAQNMHSDIYYPPSLTGLRGSHPGSFEVAHAVAWGGRRWPRPDEQTDSIYDLVVLGGGISGLSAASLYRDKVGKDARILVLDNHDDFGGHAKRNEFDVDGKKLIGYGGSQTMESPGQYSKVAAKLIKDIGIDPQRFYDYFDRSYFKDRKLGSGIYFSKEVYGADSVQKNILRVEDSSDAQEIVNSYPLSQASKQDIIRLLQSDTDYLEGKTREQKISQMVAMSYMDFLKNEATVTEEVTLLIRDSIKGYWGFGWDALSALEAYRMGMPGTWHLDLGDVDGEHSEDEDDEPYIFHFPDGNAGVARSLVRKLIPEAVPGNTMEDLIFSKVDYSLLDQVSKQTRIRLNSTGVDVRHVDGDQSVDVTYVREGQPYRVRGKHVILACYNNIIPHICPEIPAKQSEAIAKVTKVPLVYISVAVRNWKAFENLGYQHFYIPQGKLMHSFGMDFPVSIGGYQYTQKSTEPTIIHGTYCPTVPGLTEREQHKAGRRALYELSFADLERDIVRQMSGALEGGGFDAERDIAALTINRWPHGYAYEYNELYDPPEWNRFNGPHQVGAAQIGRISIANSDAAAYAYVDGAIDAANRAVNEQLAGTS